jgi:Ca2+/Na+ antiporter
MRSGSVMDALGILLNFSILVVFLVLLDRSSYAVITGAEDISKSTRLRCSSVGFIFVALSTSLPEATVSLFAAIEDQAGLAVGNVLGSNIANVCLILGISIFYGCLTKASRGMFSEYRETGIIQPVLWPIHIFCPTTILSPWRQIRHLHWYFAGLSLLHIQLQFVKAKLRGRVDTAGTRRQKNPHKRALLGH